MYLSHISLQNFRSYGRKEFNLSKDINIILGPNTIGKSNLIEAIFFLASGRSFRIDRDEQLVKFDKDIARVKARLQSPEATVDGGQAKVEGKNLELMIARSGVGGNLRSVKKYLVNGVGKRKIDFVGNFFAVLFAPNDLEIIIGSPSKRRDFIDNILIQTDRDYRLAMGFYEKGLRIRNALLHKARETGIKSEKEFAYWDNLLIIQGQKITKKREEFINYLNSSNKNVFPFEIFYDKSVISRERLLQYKDAEIASGVTLVGPHRDDFVVNLIINNSLRQLADGGEAYNIKSFGSRGQQRLAILQLKILELNYIEIKTGNKPTLLLDDIFSELDEGHINLVLDMVGCQQTIMTTTHEEFIPKKLLKKINMIELGKQNGII
jgi:DNA replication and repair protein RecF